MAFKFEKLIVWQKSLALANCVDSCTKKFPKEELFILSSQIKRAADSIALNIAEGSTNQTNPENIRFLRYALRSNIEVVCCLHLAKNRNILSVQDFETLYISCKEVLIMINALIRALEKQTDRITSK